MSAPRASAEKTTKAVLVLRRPGSIVGRLAPGGRLLIGRAPSADVTLHDPSVSRLHARITWSEGRTRPWVEDLHSANGVWLDGRRIAQAAELRDGVTLRLGSYALQVELGEDAPPALLDEGGTVRVRLFSETGPELQGRLRDPQDLREPARRPRGAPAHGHAPPAGRGAGRAGARARGPRADAGRRRVRGAERPAHRGRGRNVSLRARARAARERARRVPARAPRERPRTHRATRP
ncbi:MAG: FHA domain-containing protein [Planctomycetes bacterium]|nr:FHA domain-containing protein [Planctomycetota bacterium]